MNTFIKEKFEKDIMNYTNINALNYKNHIENIKNEVINSNFGDEYELFQCIYKVIMFGVNRFKLIKLDDKSHLFEYFIEKLKNQGYTEENKINFTDVIKKEYTSEYKTIIVLKNESLTTKEVLNNVIGVVLKELYDNPIKKMSHIRNAIDVDYKVYAKKEAELFLNLYSETY